MRLARTATIALLAPLVLGGSPDSLAVSDRVSVELAPSSVESDPAGGRVEQPTTSDRVADESATAALTSAERRMLQTAIDRFALVGLEIPDVDVRFHDDTEPCDGHDGVFHGDEVPPRLHVCVPDRGTAASDLWRQRTLIHELAHAWEHSNLDDEERSELLERLAADRWFGNDVPWPDRGGERFAETIVWGLYDQLRRPVKVDVSCRKLHADFEHITGHPPVGPVETVCMPSFVRPDQQPTASHARAGHQ